MLFLIGCIGDRDQQSNIVDIESCSPPPGAEQLWALPHVRFLVVGELHGTSETPAAFGELVCDAAMARKRVLVGLEFPESARPSFQTYLASDGTTEDISRFLTDSGWLAMVQQSADGRTSKAMWQMLERLRTLRAVGLSITLTTFVRPIRGETQTYYENDMATSLNEAALSGTVDLTIALVGNLHARKSTFNPDGVSSFDPMAMHLPKESTLSLLVISDGGEAWNCNPDCGVGPVAGSSGGLSPGVVIDAEFHSGYDGVVAVGPITASPPLLDVPR